MLITPEYSNDLSWISIRRLVKLHANDCVDILKARWLRPAFAQSYQLLRVTLSKELVAIHVWSAPSHWNNWRWQAWKPLPPVNLNAKTGSSYLLFWHYCFGFSRLLFFCVFRSVFRWFRVFALPFNTGFAIFFQLFSECCPVGFLELSFRLVQTSSYVTALDQSLTLCCGWELWSMCRVTSSILQ